MMKDIIFANPEFLYLLFILPVLILWYLFKHKTQKEGLIVSTSTGFSVSKPSVKARLRHLLPVLRMLTLALLIVVLARPQTSTSKKQVETEGIDIVLALDISGSMFAEDFKPNRLEAAKNTAVKFIDKRPDDRIGVAVFSGRSFTLSPITIDHNIVKELIESIETEMIEQQGTAIGDGLSTAVKRLKDGKAKSKVIILLTDGVNNTGFVAPLTAAEFAQSYGIRVYTIGVGSKGMAPFPFQTPYGKRYKNVKVEIDEKVLKSIAKKTDGKYFRATKNTDLDKIYGEIDKMEKTKIEDITFKKYNEEFLPFALLALALFFLEILLRYTLFRSLP